MLILWILLGFGVLLLAERLLYVKYWNRNITVKFRFSQRAVTEGESADLSERSENRKLLPLPTFGYRYYLNRSFTSLSESGKTAIALRRKFALPARRAVTYRAKIDGLLRGIYSIDGVQIFSTDLFHFGELSGPIAYGNSRLIVYPAKVPIARILPAARLLMGTVSARRTLQEDPFALKSIRPYEIYDSPKIINWKASARTGELKVNLFDNTTDEALLFLLDMGGGEIDAREELIRVASSLCQLFLQRGVSVALMANCRDCISGRPIRVRSGADAAHQITIDENLARIKLTIPVTEPLDTFLCGIPKASWKGALPVVLSADPTGAAREAFAHAPGVRDGYFLSVTDGDIRAERKPTLTSFGTTGKEAHL